MTLGEEIAWKKDCIRGINTTSLSKWTYVQKKDYCDCMLSKIKSVTNSKYDNVDMNLANEFAKECILHIYP